MNETKHTPAPVITDVTQAIGTRLGTGVPNTKIAITEIVWDETTTVTVRSERPGHESTFDSLGIASSRVARLIASAPDLLKACENLAKWASVNGPLDTDPLGDYVDAANAAIAKAKGEQS